MAGIDGRAIKAHVLSAYKDHTSRIVLLGIGEGGIGCRIDATQQTIADIDGKPHTLSTGEFTRLMLAYGAYYKALWDQLKHGD
ncbi:MAG: hypothetical protein EAZ65_00025 [Verrucomicrobia bacterium]|nr:MAG: hypothetical protein EAZ84_11790 [Verrucomicrobiota bacterium]TAE89390.1 MAG: hypothetical protein EAZ82_01870 [Verrucomicrobiota bacterium]TAF27734.1 MAG: hypothetical protein EAZ71_00025 [Verrucomicrobiota bacterium]TAF42583.1 MAG: hypothetical protein EAZ65_00025 [Verrucomicrobiota bacterium]